jgi:hypothetical protein
MVCSTANDVDELSTAVERVAAIVASVAGGGVRHVQLGLLSPRVCPLTDGNVVVFGLGDVDAVLLPLESLKVGHVAVHRETAALANRKVASVRVSFVHCESPFYLTIDISFQCLVTKKLKKKTCKVVNIFAVSGRTLQILVTLRIKHY